MFDVLDASADDVVAVRVTNATGDGFRKLYELLSEKTGRHGTVHVYEEAPNWTLSTYLSNWRGIVPDLRLGSSFEIGRYAAVGDTLWAKALYDQWRAIAPIWPVSPEEMRYFEMTERNAAIEWVRQVTDD